jgi:hypothetical protein
VVSAALAQTLADPLHTGVQILTNHVPLRGLVFSINFIALCALWGWFLVRAL